MSLLYQIVNAQSARRISRGRADELQLQPLTVSALQRRPRLLGRLRKSACPAVVRSVARLRDSIPRRGIRADPLATQGREDALARTLCAMHVPHASSADGRRPLRAGATYRDVPDRAVDGVPTRVSRMCR